MSGHVRINITICILVALAEVVHSSTEPDSGDPSVVQNMGEVPQYLVGFGLSSLPWSDTNIRWGTATPYSPTNKGLVVGFTLNRYNGMGCREIRFEAVKYPNSGSIYLYSMRVLVAHEEILRLGERRIPFIGYAMADRSVYTGSYGFSFFYRDKRWNLPVKSNYPVTAGMQIALFPVSVYHIDENDGICPVAEIMLRPYFTTASRNLNFSFEVFVTYARSLNTDISYYRLCPYMQLEYALIPEKHLR